MSTYHIETDQGTFEIEVEDSQPSPGASPTFVEKALGLPAAGPNGRSLMQDVGQFNEEMGQTGEAVAEGLGRRGVPAPISAAAGMVPTFASDIILGAVTGPGAKMAAESAPSLARRAFSRGPSIGEQLSSALKAKTDLPLKAAEKTAQLEAMLSEAGSNLGKELEKAGLKLESIPKTPDDIRSFVNEIYQFSKRDPKELLKVMSVEGLNDLREIIKVVRADANLIPAESAFLEKGAAIIDDAIGIAKPAIGKALSTWREIKTALTAVPFETKAEKMRLISQIRELREANKPGALKKAAKLVAKAAGFGAGFGALSKVFGD